MSFSRILFRLFFGPSVNPIEFPPRCVNDDNGEELIVVVQQKCAFVASEGCEIRVRGPFHRSRNFVFGVKKLGTNCIQIGLPGKLGANSIG